MWVLGVMGQTLVSTVFHNTDRKWSLLTRCEQKIMGMHVNGMKRKTRFVVNHLFECVQMPDNIKAHYLSMRAVPFDIKKGTIFVNY